MLKGGDSLAVLSAGLLNITGQVDFENIEGLWSANGCFSAIGTFDNKNPSSVYDQNTRQTAIDFDASRSSSVYGASNTVQPPALQLIPQIRY